MIKGRVRVPRQDSQEFIDTPSSRTEDISMLVVNGNCEDSLPHHQRRNNTKFIDGQLSD